MIRLVDELVCGTNPEPGKTDRDGAVVAKIYQRQAFKYLRRAMFGLIEMPTGSGKSLEVLGICWEAIYSDPKARGIIVSPQNQINEGSFDFTTKRPIKVRFGNKPGRDVVQFRPCAVSSAWSDNVIKKIVAFLKDGPGVTPSQRVLVCTHQALVLAYKHLIKKHPRGWQRFWNNVHLFVDEAHHGKSVDLDNLRRNEKYAKQIEKKAQNELGKIFNFYIKYQPGRLILVTATFMRSDRMPIVDERWLDGHKAIFKTYTLSFRRYLASMEKLKIIRLGVAVGLPEKVIEFLHNKPVCKTIIYTPRTNSPLCDGPHIHHGNQKIIHMRKSNMMNRYERSVGSRVRRDQYTITVRTRSGVERQLLDLVRGQGSERDARLKWMRRELNQGHNSFDTIFSMDLCKEGFDWPLLERVLVIRPPRSMVTMMQIIGRGLRDEKERFEFLVNLPTPGKADNQVRVDEWVKAVMGSVIGYLAIGIISRAPEWRPKQTDEERMIFARLQNLRYLAKYTREIQRGITEGKVTNTYDIVRAAVERIEGRGSSQSKTDGIAMALSAILCQYTRDMRSARDINLKLATKQVVVGDDLDCVRIVTTRLSDMSLYEIQRKYGIRRSWSKKLITKYVLAYRDKHGRWPHT